METRFLPCEEAFIKRGEMRCSCWQLCGEMSAGINLPDHVGRPVMSASCGAWAQSRFLNNGPPFQRHLDAAHVAEWKYIERDLTLPPGRSTWPVPIIGSDFRLMLVIRQRIELTDNDPDSNQQRKMGVIVNQNPRWGKVLAIIQEKTLPQFSSFEAHATSGQVMTEEIPPEVAWHIARSALVKCGFSVTKSMIEYALGQARPEQNWGDLSSDPSRGLLIESFCLSDKNQQGEVLSSISGTSFEDTNGLWTDAVKRMSSHRVWWSKKVSLFTPTAALLSLNEGGPTSTDRLSKIVAQYQNEKITRPEAKQKGLKLFKEECLILSGHPPGPAAIKVEEKRIEKRLKRVDDKKQK